MRARGYADWRGTVGESQKSSMACSDSHSQKLLAGREWMPAQAETVTSFTFGRCATSR